MSKPIARQEPEVCLSLLHNEFELSPTWEFFFSHKVMCLDMFRQILFSRKFLEMLLSKILFNYGHYVY